MCRFINLNIDMSELEEWFSDYDRRIDFYEKKIFILADTYPVLPIVTREGILKAKWGLVPHWVKTKTEAMEIRKFNINARQETIFQKPSFRGSMTTRRCLIPVTGFYEYKHLEDKSIELYEMSIFLRKIFCLAGVYDEWVDKESGKIYRSFAIITTEANKLMSEIHNTKLRMPVMFVTEKEQDIWLETGDLKIIREMMGSYDVVNLRAEKREKTIRS